MIFRDDVRFARQKKQWCEGTPRSRPSRRMLPSRQSRSWWIWPGGKGWCFFVLHEFARAFFVSQPWPPAKDLWLGDNDDVYIMKTNGMFLSNPPRLKGQHEEGWLAIGCWKPQLFGIIFQNLLQMWFLRHKKLDWSSNALPVWCLRFGFVFFWTWWSSVNEVDVGFESLIFKRNIETLWCSLMVFKADLSLICASGLQESTNYKMPLGSDAWITVKWISVRVVFWGWELHEEASWKPSPHPQHGHEHSQAATTLRFKASQIVTRHKKLRWQISSLLVIGVLLVAGNRAKKKNDLQFCSGASVWTFWNLLCGPVYLALGQFRPKGNALRSDENVVQFGAKLRDVSEFFSTMTLLDLLSQLSLGTGVSLQHLRCLDMFYQGTRCKHRPKTQGDGTFFVVNSVRKAWKYTKYWWSLLTFCRSLEDSFFRIS